jgi:hypothetical protein
MRSQLHIVAPAEAGAAIVMTTGCHMLLPAPASAGATLEGIAA